MAPPPNTKLAVFQTNTPRSGLTRVDLLAVVAALALCFALTLPALAFTKDRAGQVVCSNNLRLIGQALQLFATERTGQFPWRTRPEFGGTSTNRGGNAWWEFTPLTNELPSPRILACPSDENTRRIADSFSADPDGGLFHATYRNNAISYAIGLDATPALNSTLAAADRNVRIDPGPVVCSSGVNSTAQVIVTPPPQVADVEWTNGVHGTQGNLLRADGAVNLIGNSTVRTSPPFTATDNGRIHLLMPK